MTLQKQSVENTPLSKVNAEFLTRVERYQGKSFQRVGIFDLALLRELVERIEEVDIVGEVEILVASGNKMHDDTTSGLFVVKYNGTEYMALAGLTDK